MRWTHSLGLLPKRLKWALFWTFFWAGFGVFDAWRSSKRDGSTFSDTLRWLFRTDKPGGKAGFITALVIIAAGFAAHILNKK